jgi:hypothetical protein
MHFFFDRLSVKISERKAVQCKYISIFLLKPFLKFLEIFGFFEEESCSMRKAQPDSKCAFMKQASPYFRNVNFEVLKRCCPSFSRVNIATIAQMKGFDFHERLCFGSKSGWN